MDYGNLLSRAWRIVWHNKYLFVLGFLAALGSGGQRSPQSSYQFSDNFSFDEMAQPLQAMRQFWAEFGPLLLTLLAAAIVFGLIAWLLSLIAQAGLIDGVQQIEQGGSPGLGGSLRAGGQHLGRMIGLNLILYAPVWLFGLIMTVIGLVAFAAIIVEQDATPLRAFGILAACLVPVSCIAALYGLIATFVYPFAQRSIIISRLGILDGIRQGWHVLRRNLGNIVLLALLFLVMGFFVGLVVALVALPIGLVVLLPSIMEIIRGGSFDTGQIVLTFFTLIGLGILSAVIHSVLRAFQSATFTLAYNEFMAKAAVIEAGVADIKPSPPGSGLSAP